MNKGISEEKRSENGEEKSEEAAVKLSVDKVDEQRQAGKDEHEQSGHGADDACAGL